MRISDWSSDVGSSDLDDPGQGEIELLARSVIAMRHGPGVYVLVAGPVQAWRIGLVGHNGAHPRRQPMIANGIDDRPHIGSAPRNQDNQTARTRNGSGQHIIPRQRSEEHTSELQSLMRISYAVFCLKKKKNK